MHTPTTSPESLLTALRNWHPYEAPPAPFPNDWRSDVPSWLERVCEPESPPTGAWTWKMLALLARHAEGRVALEARDTFARVLSTDDRLLGHLTDHVYSFLDRYRDDVEISGLSILNRVERETAEALVEAITFANREAGSALHRQLRDLDVWVCRHATIEPEPPMRATVRNLMWKDDHKRLLGGATPLDWWGKHGLVADVLSTNDPETEARLRDTATMPLLRGSL